MVGSSEILLFSSGIISYVKSSQILSFGFITHSFGGFSRFGGFLYMIKAQLLLRLVFLSHSVDIKNITVVIRKVERNPKAAVSTPPANGPTTFPNTRPLWKIP
jgi:hypothetical protein